MMTSSNGNIFRVTGPLCGAFTGPGEFPTQRPVTRSFDIFFDLRLNKRLSKQPWGWWFETLSRPLWRHRNVVHWNGIQWLHKYLDFKSCMAIYESFILANINYCPLVWMFVNKTNFYILEKVHERALRFIQKNLVIDVWFLNNIKIFLFALSLCDALYSKCLNAWMV